jgi:hypothetical protein
VQEILLVHFGLLFLTKKFLFHAVSTNLSNQSFNRTLMRKLYLLFFSLLFIAVSLHAQTPSSANYVFTTNNTGSLGIDKNGNVIDVSAATNLISNDFTTTNASLLPIGFDFFFMGRYYSHYLAGNDGVVGLGLSNSGTGIVGTSTANDLTRSTFAYPPTTTDNAPVLAGFWDDLRTSKIGATVRSVVVGAAPNRCLVVQYNANVNTSSTTSADPADAVFQIRIYETTGEVEYVYGKMSVGPTSGTVTASIGFSAGATDNTFMAISSLSTYATTTTAASEAATQSLVNSSTAGDITGLHSPVEGSRRVFRFTPPVPTSATALTFSNVGSTFMKLNWVDAPNELLYSIYVSSDGGTTYSPFGTVPGNTTSFTASGLTPSTSYQWRVYSVSEGALSSPALSGTQSTTATAPLSGVYTINNLAVTGGRNFQSFTDAIAAVNGEGISGPVTFNAFAGQTFTEDIPALTATGTAANTITFQRFNAGANPVIKPTGGAGIADFGFAISGGDYITIDGIDISINTGSAVEYGYLIRNASATNGAQNNTIRNVAVTLNRTNTSCIGILQASSTTGGGFTPTAASGQNDNNKYYNLNIQNVYSGVYLLGASSTFPDAGCEVGVTAGGTTYIGGTTANDIGNGSTAVFGIQANTQTAYKIFNCIVRNVSASTTLRGIYTTGSLGGSEIYNNQVYTLVNTSTTSTAAVNAIEANLSTTGTNTTRIYNNMVYDISSAYTGAASATRQIKGILLGSGSLTSVYNVDFNSVRIDGSGAATISNVCIELGGTTALNNIRNNIFANFTGAQTGVAKHYAIRSTSATAMGGIGSITDYNLYYVANTTNGYMGLANATDQATTFAWRTTMNPSHNGIDANSKSSNPQFVSATDLHINPATPTEVESGGSFFGGTITWVGTDIDANTRNATKPDLGADEGTFTPLDITGPGIVYNNLVNTSSTANRVVAAFATITDMSGVNTAAGTSPRLYYKRSTDANAFIDNTATTNGWKYVEASNATSPFSFTIDYALLNGGTGVAAGQSIQYFVVAQDLAGTPNVGMWSGTFAAQPSSVALTSAAFPIGGTINAYSVVTAYSGNYTVGTGQPFLTLTGVGGLFAALNAGVISGNIDATVTSNTTEDGTNGLNQWIEEGAGGYKVTIRPDAATERILSGAVANGMIRLNGADRVIFDGRFGGSGQYLRFRNTNTSNGTFTLLNDAINDTIRYCIVEGASTSSTTGTIFFSTTTGTLGNSSNLIANCLIRDRSDAAGVPANAIYSSGTAGATNNDNIVRANTIQNFTSNGISVSANSSNWTIGGTLAADGNNILQQAARTGAFIFINFATGNTNTIAYNNIYQTAGTNTGGFTGIAVTGSGIGQSIHHNSIGGATATRTGTPLLNTAGSTANGISITAGTTTPSDVYSNTISNFGNLFLTSTSGIANGILVNGGTVNVGTLGGNMLGGAVITGIPSDTLVTSYDNGWINITGGTNVVVENNTITNASYHRGANDRNAGIFGGGGTNTIIRNNIVRNIRGNNAVTLPSTFHVSGILVSSGVSLVEGNTIDNVSNINTGTAVYPATGIYWGLSAAADIRKNKVSNVSAVGTGTGTSAPYVAGIYVSTGTPVVSNNQVIIGANSTGETRVQGIADNGSATPGASYYYNSVYLSGATGGATNGSFAFLRSGTAGVKLRNNLLYNERTGGVGNFAIGNTAATASTNWTGATSNYNLFVTSDPAQTGSWGAASPQSFAGWKTSSVGDTSSYAEVSSNIPSATLFVDVANNNLNINSASNLSWYVNGKGIAGTESGGTAVDFTGDSRSVTMGVPTDIGADEFNTATTPPNAVASGAPAAATATTYSFAGRKIVEINWGAGGAPPSAIAVKYFSGVPPGAPNPPLGINSYFDVQATGGAAYTYSIKLYYTEAEKNALPDATLKVIKRDAPNPWVSAGGVPGSDANGKFVLSDNTLNSFSQFSLGDVPAVLPVSITSIKAYQQGSGVEVEWNVTTQINVLGYEVERSVDGRSFTKVGTVQARGNATSAIAYNWLDASPVPGNNFYRIRIVNLIVAAQYTSVAKVFIGKGAEGIAIYPNPVKGNLVNLQLTNLEKGNYTLRLTNQLGQTVFSKVITHSGGSANMSLNIAGDLANGVYQLQVVGKTTSFTQTLVK